MYSKIDSSPFLSGYTYRTLASQAIADKNDTHHMKTTSIGIDPDLVGHNSILYVSGVETRRFLINIAPKIKNRFSLVSAMWDDGVDQSYESILPDNLITWWSINCHINHPKVKPIPLGLQNLHWGWDENVQSDPETYRLIRKKEKTKTLLASFSVENNTGERMACLKNAEKTGKLHMKMFLKQDRKNDKFVGEYFEEASHYKFVLCPWGAGVDTHRLWESMYLGSIPITRRHYAYRDFEDYPILFVDNWDELQHVDFDAVFEEKSRQLKSENRIYFDHWKNKIQGGM